MTKLTKGALLAAVPLAATLATAANAGAFYLQEQSIRGAGRAFSGEVADRGTDSLWWNPAAIGGMTGFEAFGGVSAILPEGDVINTNTRIVRPGQPARAVGGDQVSSNPINNGYLPTGAAAFALTPQIAIGVAVTSPFSFTTNYKNSSWTRYTSDKSKLRTFDIQPSIAFATDAFSIGVAANVEHVSAGLSNSLPNLSPLLPDGHQTLRGKGWDVGYSVGGQYRAGVATIGLSYKSSIKHTLDGSVTTAGLISLPGIPLASNNGVINAKATFKTPWQIIGGVRVPVTPMVTVNAQVVRLGWGKFDAIRLGAPINAALPQQYRNTWSFAGGLDVAATEKLTLRTGVQYDQTPTRDGFRDTRVPDGNRWNFAAGAGYKVTPAITIDAAFNYLPVDSVGISRPAAAFAGTAVQTPILTDGRLDNARVFVFGLGGKLAF